MSRAPLQLAPLDTMHDRCLSHDDSGARWILYLPKQSPQDIRRPRLPVSWPWQMVSALQATYATSASLLLAIFRLTLVRSCRAYPTVPAVRMGPLGYGSSHSKGQGLGGALVADALDRTARSEIAAFALMVDAKDEGSRGFYRHHGFIALPDSPLTLFLPLATVRRS